MSVLVMTVLSKGIVFGADRNITEIYKDKSGEIVHREVLRRKKVFKWPQNRAVVGYTGFAELDYMYMDKWLQNFINANKKFENLPSLSQKLAVEVQDAYDRKFAAGRTLHGLLVNLGGFHEGQPQIWFIRNEYEIDSQGRHIDVRRNFQVSEMVGPRIVVESGGALVSAGSSDYGSGVRAELARRDLEFDPLWFQQGTNRRRFNLIEAFVRGGFAGLHSSGHHRHPETLADWEAHVRMIVLTYGAYFEAFHDPAERSVGGGVNIESIPWPE